MKEKTKIISIVGPTACGKTKLAVSLASNFDIEIISADSMQVYKEFNILSAKPTKKERFKVRHHLIDILSVEENYSVAEFTKSAHKCILEIRSRGNLPIIVGGTGLYVDSLIKNISYSEPKKEPSRKDLKILSNIELMEILLKIDGESAQKIHINDHKRLLRAVEFFYTTGYPISRQVELSKKLESPYSACIIGLNFLDRQKLYEQINKRVDKMFNDGLIDEVKNVYSSKKISKTAKSAIGYKEIIDFINSSESFESAKEKLKQATRRYAKRQLTWFRRNSSINWIYIDKFNDFSCVKGEAEKIIKKFM